MAFLATMSCEMVELDIQNAGGVKPTMGFFFKGNGVECEVNTYDTDDPFIQASRSMLSMSIVFGGIAGILVGFEWLVCQVCCAGLLEGVAYLLAWVLGACSFVFYGSAMCNEEEYEKFIKENNLTDAYAAYLEEGGANFLKVDGKYDGCEPMDASHFMTVSVLCFFVCGCLLFWYVHVGDCACMFLLSQPQSTDSPIVLVTPNLHI